MSTYQTHRLLGNYTAPFNHRMLYFLSSRVLTLKTEPIHITGCGLRGGGVRTKAWQGECGPGRGTSHCDVVTKTFSRIVSFSLPVWPDVAIFCTLSNFLKPLATINLTKSPTFSDNFCKGVKIFHFLVKSFLGNFYRHLAIFFWSHCSLPTSHPHTFSTRIDPESGHGLPLSFLLLHRASFSLSLFPILSLSQEFFL